MTFLPQNSRNAHYLVVRQLLTQKGSAFKVAVKFQDFPPCRTYSILK